MHTFELKNGHLYLDDRQIESVNKYKIESFDSTHLVLNVELTVLIKDVDSVPEKLQLPQPE